VFVKKTAGGGYQSAFIASHTVFVFDENEVIYQIFMHQIFGVDIIEIRKYQTHFSAIIANGFLGIAFGY
jgi:hypothetical protein